MSAHACVADGGCVLNPSDQGWGRGKQPVINVSWDDITKQYLPWLSRKTGNAYRLPTEVEWEYVARAGMSTRFWWGASVSTDHANYEGSFTYGGGPKGESRKRTVPVDSFSPNPWGLYNVHGNVWEWVQAGTRATGARLRMARRGPETVVAGPFAAAPGSTARGPMLRVSQLGPQLRPELQYWLSSYTDDMTYPLGC
jgi:formylglycine-generating enzyme required for sulfatase activity